MITKHPKKHDVLLSVYDWRGRRIYQQHAFATAEDLAATALVIMSSHEVHIYDNTDATRACWCRTQRLAAIGETGMRAEFISTIEAWQ